MTTPIYTPVYEETLKAVNQLQPTTLPMLVTGLDESSRALLIAAAYREQPRPMLIVESNLQKLSWLQNDLMDLLPAVPIIEFTVEESMAAEFSLASLDSTVNRVAALNLLAQEQNGIVITNLPGIRKRLTPLNKWKDEVLNLSVGQEYDRQAVEYQLSRLGFHRKKMVLAPGEFSIRGSIVDVYPLNTDNPLRLDFFDVELDSMRSFDPETQVSIQNVERFQILPAKETLMTLEDQTALLPYLESELKKVSSKMQDETLKGSFIGGMQQQIERLKSQQELVNASAYMELAEKEEASIVDYLPKNGLLIISDYSKLAAVQNRMDQDNQYWQQQEISKGNLLPHLNIRLNALQVITRTPRPILHLSLLQKGFNQIKFSSVQHFHYRGMNPFYHQMELIKPELEHWLYQKFMIQIMVKDKHEAKKTLELFEEADIGPVLLNKGEALTAGVINICIGNLSKGFELPMNQYVMITRHELFKQMRKANVRQQNISNAERIKSYNELNPGDYVVHIAHGIGIYRGIETLEINGNHRDLLAVEYKDNARVMIPVDQLNLLQKYVGSEHKQPKVHKLGGTEWVRTKQKVQSSVEDIADELIELYSKRQAEEGFAFSEDSQEQAEFEDAFSYVETEDQLRSSIEIKKDMEMKRPMDRLLVGDVGYGKTEVAMRAVFKAVMEGKQVALLVPTTILAQQHFNTLTERFQSWPFEIGLLSRFVPAKQQKETIQKIAQGAISIVIGTHRLLSKDIKFNDLGLLIVDEEQRFGVKHKERLKQLRANIDVLTLTATPIPRTLHMSMVGIRDLSLIETPPNNRFPVQTYVMEQNEGAIKTGIERELERGGQIFYLYNRVSTIYKRALEIEQLVPQARVAIAHGQMSETELETVLVDFIEGRYDVLVTTTIIETGVDIPNANTLFIENADKMGLSTLYQLRGRVGRTHRVAYAYLMYDPFKQLSEVSEKRLNAIKEFTELGSGFKIAMRDLSIRGAGNLLGQQQSGYIDSVGYDMYSKMLEEAVARKKGQVSEKLDIACDALDWNVSFEAYLPSDYIEDERQKIQLYQRIHKIDSLEQYQAVQDQLIDRFGEFPDEVANLLDVALIRHFAVKIGVTQIESNLKTLTVHFNEQFSQIFKGPLIFKALKDVPLKANIQVQTDRIYVVLDIYRLDVDQWLSALIKFTQAAYQIVLEESEE